MENKINRLLIKVKGKKKYLFGKSESEIRKIIKILLFLFFVIKEGLLIKVKGKIKGPFLVKVKVKLGKY